MIKSQLQIVLLLILFMSISSTSFGQFAKDAPKTDMGQYGKVSPKTDNNAGLGEAGTTLGEAKILKYKCGAEITAARGACKGILVTTPLPINWSEQSVRVIEEDISSGIRVTERKLAGGAMQMVIAIAQLPSGEMVKAVKTYEITSHPQYAPDNTERFHIPTTKEMPPLMRNYLKPSPMIECNDPKIKALAKTIGTEEETAWKQVEAVYDWVRNEITYKNGKLKGAVAALKDKTGDCEELTSLFIAICRAKGIPARTVWVPGHCYPEFYLMDDKGNGYWFPCQAAGTRAFGEMPETYIILQKGDSFPDPVNPAKKVRYVPEGVKGTGGEPRANFIREKVEE